MKLNKIKNILRLNIILGGLVIFSCTPEEFGEGNGLSNQEVKSVNTDFKIVQTKANNYTLTADNKSNINFINHKWDIGDGLLYVGRETENIFIPDAGTYTIVHEVSGIGGEIGHRSSQILVVPNSDPNAGNLIVGGKFTDPIDISKWTILGTSTDANWTFTGEKATLKATGWAGKTIYQAINVVKDKKYVIDMVVSSITGCSNTWFETYVGYSVPVDGSDYTEGGKLRTISTWDGCGTGPFSGKISNIGCTPANNLGIFTATQTGTVYLVIRGGGEDMKDGISIDNVEFRGM